MTTPSTLSIDVKSLNTTLSQTIAPLFWGVVLAAVAVPIAAAAGGWVAKKITGSDKDKR